MLQKTYTSPRISAELFDCSMPLSMDTYGFCSFDCLYCFSYFQNQKIRLAHNISCVNPEKVKRIFLEGLKWESNKPVTGRKYGYPVIAQRKIMQWGGLNDQFDYFEKKYGVTLELLKFFDEIDYPLSFSTKSAWWASDKRYTDLFQKHTHNWHVKFSIITLKADLAAQIERKVPTPQERLEAMKKISDLGVHTTLRLRPYIPQLSDDWRQLITEAKNHGADSVSSEWLCIDSRSNKLVRDRFNQLSKVLGYDIFKFYLEHSTRVGYMRLTPTMKRVIFKQMKQHCDSLGLRFHVSDAFCRDLNKSANCCGVPPEWNSCTGHFGEAIIIAKRKGWVTYSDIKLEVDKILGAISYRYCCGILNTCNSRKRSMFWHQTMADYFRAHWNNPDSPKGPVKMYGGLLVPVRKDSNGDVVYAYKKPRL